MPGDDNSRRAERRGARSSELTQAVICPSHPAGAAAASVPHGSLAATNLPHSSASMQTTDLRIPLLTGNYNYVRDGPNQALNHLVGFLLDQAVAVRIYATTIDIPAFEPVGELVGIPPFTL